METDSPPPREESLQAYTRSLLTISAPREQDILSQRLSGQSLQAYTRSLTTYHLWLDPVQLYAFIKECI